MSSEPSPIDAPERRHPRLDVDQSWLLRLRWFAVVGQLATIAFAHWLLEAHLPWPALLSVIAVVTVTNALFALWLRSRPGQQRAAWGVRVLAALMTLDLLALTCLLYLTGGLYNPFSVFFFVNLALAAVLLPARWCWVLTLLAVLCLTGLFFSYIPLEALSRSIPADPGSAVTLAQLGFLVAFAACGAVITYFVTRVTRELRHRELELRIAEQRRARSERLEALATLAAGADHELASPLSTIAVIVNDLAKHLEGTRVPESVIEDVGLMRGELDHCRKILDGLASSAGQAAGEELQPITAQRLIEEVVGGLRRRERVHVEIDPAARDQKLLVPMVGTAQAIRGVVRNALDASAPDQPVTLHVERRMDWMHIEVRDRGTGMPPDVLARAGEPFFSTKQVGQGIGLGLFLTRNTVERLGGTFRLESEPDAGTTATMALPITPDRSPSPH